MRFVHGRCWISVPVPSKGRHEAEFLIVASGKAFGFGFASRRTGATLYLIFSRYVHAMPFSVAMRYSYPTVVRLHGRPGRVMHRDRLPSFAVPCRACLCVLGVCGVLLTMIVLC